jgi:lactococcin 972 family bacteriocin
MGVFRMKKVVLLSYLVLTLGAGIGAKAATQYPSAGGTWNFGVEATGSYSDYFHGSRTHSATVSKGTKASRAQAGRGAWARGRLWEFSGCNFYYNVL